MSSFFGADDLLAQWGEYQRYSLYRAGKLLQIKKKGEKNGTIHRMAWAPFR